MSHIDYNFVYLTGTIATEPNLQQLPDGNVRLKFILFVPRPKSLDASDQSVDVIFIAVHGPRAEQHSQYLKKGDWVRIEGRLETRPWFDRIIGRFRNRLEVNAQEIRRAPEGNSQLQNSD